MTALCRIFVQADCPFFIYRDMSCGCEARSPEISACDIMQKLEQAFGLPYREKETGERQMKQNQNVRAAALGYYLILYILWAALECVIVPKLELHLSHAAVDVIKETVCKILFWFIPALILIIRHSDSMFLPKSEILGNAKKTVTYIPMWILIAVFTAWHLLPNYFHNGTIVLSPSFKAADILISIFVGITEEMVFRGFLLNTELKEQRPWLALSGNAVMFLLIHFPIWLREDVFVTYMTSFAFMQLIVLSMIFGFVFVKSRSIVVPIILHAYWDMLCFAFA